MTKNIIRMLGLSLLAGGLLSASPLCTGGFFSTGGDGYLSGGGLASCHIGTIEFSNFNISLIGTGDQGAQAQTDFNPALVSVNPNLGNSAFNFGISPTDYYNPGTFNLTISFTAQESDINKKINTLSSGFVAALLDGATPSATVTKTATCDSGCSSTTSFGNDTAVAGVAGVGTTILGADGVSGPINLSFVLAANLPAPEDDNGILYQAIHFSNLNATVADAGSISGGGVPEPGTIALLIGGLGFLGIRKRFAR
jgi:hypothetical protein